MNSSKPPRRPSVAPADSRYDPACTRCPRLAGFLCEVKNRYPDYFCRPVPQFGHQGGRLLIVGLAPGLHGANATGRPFTGDHAGIMLYRTLYKFGFASASVSRQGDKLQLFDCMITNAVKCLPPANKPIAAEVNTCRPFLVRELGELPHQGVVLALGKLAHDSVIRAFGFKPTHMPFRHGGELMLPEYRTLISSYHCSRYNTQTRRLTVEMFEKVFAQVKSLMA